MEGGNKKYTEEKKKDREEMSAGKGRPICIGTKPPHVQLPNEAESGTHEPTIVVWFFHFR